MAKQPVKEHVALKPHREADKRVDAPVEETVKETPKTSQNDSYEPSEASTNSITVSASFYTAFCAEGCTGRTATGLDVSNTIYSPQGYRIIAAPKSVPFYTKMKVELSDGSSFVGVVLDRGGAIKEGKIDILVASTEEALSLGRQSAKITILEGD